MINLTPARLLVVDDEVGSIRLLSSVVQEFGEVFFATNGAEAVAMVRDKRPDLVLLDAEMPGMDGFAACTAIKADPACADLPILFVTAHSGMDSEAAALALGAVDFISKPISPPIVKARVRTHLALKQRTDQLRQLAAVDGLTGIANRRAFDEALVLEWRRACRNHTALSVVMIDVDYFKAYNDHYGHQAGDDCLRAVARALEACCRRPGEMVARYGGEEFCAILPNCPLADAARFAEHLRHAVAALALPHATSDSGRRISISLGVASMALGCTAPPPPPGALRGPCPSRDLCRDSLSVLLAQADAALYQAKHAGRDRVALAAASQKPIATAPLATRAAVNTRS